MFSVAKSISSQSSSVDISTAFFYATLSDLPLDGRATSVGSLAINQFNQATRRVGFIATSMLTVAGGRRDEPFPYDPLNFSYPTPSTLLPLNSNKLGTSTIGQQSGALVNLTLSLIEHVRIYNEQFESVRKQVSGSCSCPSSTNLTLITSLTRLNATFGSFSKVTTKAISVSFWNSTVRANVTKNFNYILDYMKQFENCTKCLLTNIASNGARGLKQYCNGEFEDFT